MKTIKFTLTSIVALMFTSVMPLTAQFSTRSTIGSMYDDNVNNNALQLKSSVTSLNLNSGYTWESERSALELYYDGMFTYYASLLERTNQFHSLNIDFTQLYGDDDQNVLTAGGALGTGLNRDAYVIFDHSQLSGFINYKYFVNDWMIHKIGYSFRALSFTSLDDFSYTEHAVFAHAALGVTSTTTVILQTDLGTKFYSTTPSGSTSSMRKGMMSSLLPSVSQLIGMVKIGQRITDDVGVSVAERYQWNIQKQTRYLSSDFGYISDDELFDDHYGYEGFHTSAVITSLLSESVTLKLSGGIQNRLYSSLAAYDWDGNVVADQRIDARTYGNILLQKEFYDLGVTLKTSLDIIRNISNDAYYDYSNTAITVEFMVPF